MKEDTTSNTALSDLLGHPDLRTLVTLALREDAPQADITSALLVPARGRGRARLVARAEGVVAGLFLLHPQSPLLSPFQKITARLQATDGESVQAGQILAVLNGPARDLLGLERTLLNFLQRLSGIATLTARFVRAAGTSSVRIQETRKTCPGWRLLDKCAVTLGGGTNHRFNLSDRILIKENHLSFLSPPLSPAEAVGKAIRTAREGAPSGFGLEVEVEDLEQFQAALTERPDIIMLDEFRQEEIVQAVALRNRVGQKPLLEVSGGVRLETVQALAALGVERISVGALTHSVPALDLALSIERQM